MGECYEIKLTACSCDKSGHSMHCEAVWRHFSVSQAASDSKAQYTEIPLEVQEAAVSPEDTAGADILMSPSHALEELPCAGVDDLHISRVISGCQEAPVWRDGYAADLIAVEGPPLQHSCLHSMPLMSPHRSFGPLLSAQTYQDQANLPDEGQRCMWSCLQRRI